MTILPLKRLLGGLKRVILRNGQDDLKALSRKQRIRRDLTDFIHRSLPKLRLLFFLIGYAWMILLPYPHLGHGIYIDENALQPGQVNTYWSWDDVHVADVYLEHLENLRDRNASSLERANFLRTAFMKLGIPADTQAYSFKTGAKDIEGVNAYAVMSAPRSSGTEAIVIAASWRSLNKDYNLRGIATVLSLARYLKKYSLWAKDIVFVANDGHLEGMQAWLNSYYAMDQRNLEAEPLTLRSGVIWTALAIDYPGHSFSHLGVFFEGLNGRLPNQDLMNSLNVISTHTGGVPVLLYDHLEQEAYSKIPNWLPKSIRDHELVKGYVTRARNILRHIQYQMPGKASGTHGLFHQHRIDAITLFAVPATGPHGFHSLGRTVESTLRTMNNLLERLHASFFFYFLTGPGTFLKIGEYLPSAVIISVAMMFGGLLLWTDAGWTKKLSDTPNPSKADVEHEHENIPVTVTWETRRRRVLTPLSVMLATHTAGGIIFYIATSPWFTARHGPTTSYLPIVPFCLITFSIISSLLTPDTPGPSAEKNSPSADAPLWMILKAFNLCLASTVISIISVLNFSLAATLALLLGVPLSISSPSRSLFIKMIKAMSYHLLLAPLWWILLARPVSQFVRDWEMFGVWFVPFACLVYLPLVLQAMIVCMLNE